ncbi:hypothetical protein C9374_008846 [Naegleria lovaniensis]|uniref:Uncharacterized protein n=1 Tax=Naegleria lovaniensis TaxID=51637 RepID=A0AA88GID8_NAELO|nr:uncharacterized protein C9374_008846 [Naegleria lovaniensis]KAG2377761.1 hypothetical protein C9374_008846 [Naegleria lovaniensis]
MQKHYKVPLLDEYHLFVEENSESIVIPRDGGDELSFYLEENLLGVIIPALQELLKDSSMVASPEYASDDMKQQEHTKSTNVYSKVDPLSWIAMYLIRNNPKHSSEIQNHPYYKLLKEHVEHIRPLVEQSRKTLQKSQEDIRHEIKDLALQKFKSK